MKCPICDNPEMVLTQAEAMGHSYWCGRCKHDIHIDFDKGKMIIDSIETEVRPGE